MPKVINSWDASDWDELRAAIEREHRGWDAFEYIKHVLRMRNQQRIRDKERADGRRQIYKAVKDDPEKYAELLAQIEKSRK